MTVRFHKNFEKKYRQLTKPQKSKFQERVITFQQDEFNPILNNHALIGKYQSYRSINITGDLRALYKKERDIIIFVALDSHSNLYG